MIYFRFNTNNFTPIEYRYTETDFREGKPISVSLPKKYYTSIAEIHSYYFKMLRTELGLKDFFQPSYNDLLGLPANIFGIDNEQAEKSYKILSIILKESANFPIQNLDNKSLKDLGIEIEICKVISNQEVELLLKDYINKNNLMILTEEVLWKNLTSIEKAKKFLSYFENISTSGRELIILDPYFLKDDSLDYCELVSHILNESKAQSIIIITDSKNFNQTCYRKISNEVNISIVVKYTDIFHDRFWIADRKKGFYTGTSFNGIGKKISLLNMLSETDVELIVNELQKNNII